MVSIKSFQTCFQENHPNTYSPPWARKLTSRGLQKPGWGSPTIGVSESKRLVWMGRLLLNPPWKYFPASGWVPLSPWVWVVSLSRSSSLSGFGSHHHHYPPVAFVPLFSNHSYIKWCAHSDFCCDYVCVCVCLPGDILMCPLFIHNSS